MRAHVVWLRFRDGTCGEIDLAPALRGQIRAPLKDPRFFSEFTIRPEFHTLVWPNGADFAPEFLHDNTFGSKQSLNTRGQLSRSARGC